MSSTGQRIRDQREKRKLTQERLAAAAQISKGFLSDVENDKRNISSQALLRIANKLGTSVDYLLRGEVKVVITNEQPINIPTELSNYAEEAQLSYAETLTVLQAHNSVTARRGTALSKEFTRDDWKDLHEAIKKVFG